MSYYSKNSERLRPLKREEARKARAKFPERYRAIALKYRNSHLEQERSRFREYRRKQADEFRIWKKVAGPCTKCGNDDGRVLDFHHLEPEKKEFPLGVSQWYKQPLVKLIEELAKCEVLCANCHRIEEFENGMWRRGNWKRRNKKLIANDEPIRFGLPEFGV